ncbi:hypothetical protein [Corynebacterium casei]|uniref:hypothetical protein n=1 Tax=Corynebacterium casei TaxID=160386 RepID=UPI003FD591A2
METTSPHQNRSAGDVQTFESNSTTIAKLSESLWQELDVKVYNFDDKVVHVPDYNLVEIFVDEATGVSRKLIEDLKRVVENIVLCVPLHELGNSHLHWYGSGIWLQGWMTRKNGEISFFEQEIA